MTDYTLEDFEKRTEHWSIAERVDFLMQGNWWCDAITEFVKENWDKQDDDFSQEEVDVYELLHVKGKD